MTAVILTEGGQPSGMGHIERCKSLYDALIKREIATKIFINGDNSLNNILKGYDFKIYNWLENQLPYANIGIIDSYHLTNEKCVELATKYPKILFIDDLNLINYPRGIVVNPAINSTLCYKPNSNIKYLLGENYVMLRNEFRKNFDIITNKKVKNIMITIGGSDILNLTAPIVDIINKNFPNFFMNIVVGTGFLGKINNINQKIYYGATQKEMCQLMRDSDIIISACGQTIFEIIQTRSASILVKVIDNQKFNADFMKKNNFAKFIDLSNLEKSILQIINEYTYDNRMLVKQSMSKMNFCRGVDNILDELILMDGEQNE